MGWGGSGLKLHLESRDVTSTEGPSGRGAQGLSWHSACACRVGRVSTRTQRAGLPSSDLTLIYKVSGVLGKLKIKCNNTAGLGAGRQPQGRVQSCLNTPILSSVGPAQDRAFVLGGLWACLPQRTAGGLRKLASAESVPESWQRELYQLLLIPRL